MPVNTLTGGMRINPVNEERIATAKATEISQKYLSLTWFSILGVSK